MPLTTLGTELVIAVIATITICVLIATSLYLGSDRHKRRGKSRVLEPKNMGIQRECRNGHALEDSVNFCPVCGAEELDLMQGNAFQPVDVQKDNIPLPGGMPTNVKIPDFSGGTGAGRLSDSMGSLLYFWMCLAAIIVPVISLAAFGLNSLVIILLFLPFPIVGVFSGYMFKRMRTSAAARDLDAMLKKGLAVVYHIGIDNKAKLVGFRRGATGRWHGPQMKLNSDSTHKATYSFYNTVSAVAHSLTVSQINPEMMYYITKLLEYSEKVGDDGRKKNMAEIADIMEYLNEREEELNVIATTVESINAGKLSIDEYIDRRYHNLYWKDGKNFDEDIFQDLKKVTQNYCSDDWKLIKAELAKIKAAKEITVQHRDFHMEFDKDLQGRVIGGRLVEDRILRFDDFRNALPTGGTAESAFIGEQQAIIAGSLEKGISTATMMKWIIVLMGILFSGVAGYLVIKAALGG